MKLVKSLLLGSAAGLAAVAGAQAADLPVKKAVAVDYVRVCSTYGAGYFFIPGMDTCLRISGFAQLDVLYTEQEAGRPEFDTLGMRGRARVNIDARQATEFGLLRAFLRLDGRRQTGVFNSGGEAAVSSSTTGFLTPGGGVYDVRFPDQAYVQFGGLTAGRAQSFFDFYSSQDLFTTQLVASDTKTQTLAYTFTLGGGLSLTLAAEDQVERRAFGTPFGIPAGFNAPVGFNTTTNPFVGGLVVGQVNAIGPGGFEYPDGVANLRIDQAWGSAQLSGAVHQIRATNVIAAPGTAFAQQSDDELGFAVQAGVQFKLPFIAAGDELWLQATYADGAGHYAGLSGGARRETPIRLNVTDAYVDRFGNVQTTEVFSVGGKFLHYWLPNLRSNFFAGYQEIEFGGRATALSAPTSGVGPAVLVGFPDFKIYEAGANLIWSPVKNLDIGVEAVYRKIETQGLTTIGTVGTFGPGGAFTAATNLAGRVTDEEDVWEARLRIQREF